MWIPAITIGLSLYLGFAISRNRLCFLLAASEALTQKKLSQYAAFVLVISAAAIVALPLAWVQAPWAALPRVAALTVPILLGAVIAGSGAFVNGACPIGTLMRIGIGELQFLFTLAGLAVGFVMLDSTQFLPTVATLPGRSNASWVVWIGTLAAFGCLYWVADCYLARRQDAQSRLLRIMMPILGVAGALLFCLSPHPTYGDAIRQLVAQAPTALMTRIGTALVGAAAIIGALLGAFTSSNFRLKWPSAVGFVRCLLGGIVMAVGGKLMGSGGEQLMLSGVPSGASTSILCLVVMSLTIFGWVALSRLIESRKAV